MIVKSTINLKKRINAYNVWKTWKELRKNNNVQSINRDGILKENNVQTASEMLIKELKDNNKNDFHLNLIFKIFKIKYKV